MSSAKEIRKEWGKDKIIIYVKETTKKRMESVGRQTESNDHLINRLIDSYLQLKSLMSKRSYSEWDFMNFYGPDVLRKDQLRSMKEADEKKD